MLIWLGWRLAAVACVLLLIGGGAALAQEKVQFLSLDDNGAGQPGTMIDGYLFRPKGNAPRPAVVLLHGCWSLFDGNGRIEKLERAWARRLNASGYVVLLVDSYTTRGIKEMCSPDSFQLPIFEKRPKDAYGALRYLQAQSFVQPDRIAAMGWFAGGGAILLAVGNDRDRPPVPAQGDFKAAVLMYPSLCDDQYYKAPWIKSDKVIWTTKVPLLILDGGEDVWAPAGPCRTFADGAVARGSSIEMKIYPNAYHSFDVPNLPTIKLPAYREPDGVVPVIGTNAPARKDALRRVPAFLARYLGKDGRATGTPSPR